MRPHTDMNVLNLDTYGLSLITAKEDILNDRISTDWAVFTYERKWSLKLMDSGVGGLEELIKKFNKSLVLYGLCRVPDPKTQGPRFILIYWVGENVDASRKEVSTQHLPAIRRFFKEASVMLRAQRIEDISQEAVTQALNKVPQPARSFHRPRLPGSHDLVGTNYTKTNPAIEMKYSKRDSFWQRNEREEERRKEQERLRFQEERITMEKARIERERLEEEDRERRIQEKERMVEEQRKEQARLEAEQRRLEKARWAQQQREFEEEMKGRFRRSQSIEMAAEAAALVSGRSLHPRDIFRQHERSVSCSNSPPSTPSSPGRSPSSFSGRTTFRYQRSMTESILTPPTRSPSYFPGFQKRESFSGPSSSTPPACSPAFIFSKAPLPGTSTKMDSLPSFIPPPISTKRGSPSHVKENISPQSSISPPQSSISSPKSSISPPRSTIPPPQSSISTPQSSISTPQSTISPPQSAIPPPWSSIPPPQSSISPPQSAISAPESAISAPESSISPPQSSISPPQSSISPLQSTILPPQSSTYPLQRTLSPHKYLYDVPYRAEYVTLTSEEPLQQGMDIKAQTRPPALNIPPSTNFDTPDATNTNIPGDVYRAEFVPVDILNTSEHLVEQGYSPKSLRSYHTPEGPPAAIKATVSISTPVSEIAFASVTPVTDAKISTSPPSNGTPGLNSPLSAKAIEPTFAPQEVVPEPALAAQASSTSAASLDQRLLPSPPVSVTAGKLPETKSYFYSISSYESHASSKTNVEGLPPSPLADSPITLEGKTPFPSSLRSILQYVAPPPYTPFSARTTDSITVKAPAFAKSLNTRSASISAGTLPGISSTNVPNLETLTVNSKHLKPQTLHHIETQEHNASRLSDHPPQSQIKVTNESADVQPVNLAPASSSLATVSQPESQPEFKAEVPTVDSVPRKTSVSTSQMELNKDQVKVSSNNLPEAKAEPIYNQIKVSSAENFPLSQTEPINITFKIPSAETVSVINLPEPQVEAGIPPTEVLPLLASVPTNNPPEFQAKPSKKQTDVSPVESLPVEDSLCSILPEPQKELSKKQLKVSPVESLPVVASLSSTLPESQDELNEKQLRVSLVESLPVVTSLCTNLPEPQEELNEKQTKVSPVDSLPMVASLCAILPEPEEELREKQTKVSLGEPLPVVASLSSIIPESQDKLSEKQMEVSPVESLPVVASLSGIVPESRHELSEKQTEVSPEDFLPVVASLCTILPEPQEELCEKQIEVSPVAPFSGILPEPQEEPIQKQTEVSPVESLPEVASISGILSESQAEPSDFQTSLPILPTLPMAIYPPTNSLLGNQAEHIEKQAGIPTTETFPASASLCSAIHLESQTEHIGKQTEGLLTETVSMEVSSFFQSVPSCNQTDLSSVETIPIPENLPIGGFNDSPFNYLVSGTPQFDTFPVSVSLSTERSTGSEHTEYQSDVPSIEAIHEPVSFSTENSQKLSNDQDQVLQPQTSPVSFILPKSEPSINQTKVSNNAATQLADFLYTDSAPTSQAKDNINQSKVSADVAMQLADFLYMESSAKSQVEDSIHQIEVPLSETLPESTILPSDSSTGYQNNQMTSLTDFISVSPTIPHISSKELQEEPCKIQTKVPPSESLSLSASLPLDCSLNSQAQTIKEQIGDPPLQYLPVTASLTANISCQSLGEPIIYQSELPGHETLPLSAFIPTDTVSEPQADTYDRQPEILLSDIVPIISTLPNSVSLESQGEISDMPTEVPPLQTLPVTDSLSTNSSAEGQTEPEDDRTEVPQVQSLPATVFFLDSSFRSEDEANQIEVPVPLYLPDPLPIENSSGSSVYQPEENIPVSFSLPVCSLPEPLIEIRDFQTELLPTEGKNESPSFPPVMPAEVQAEPYDGPSEILPTENITESTPLPTITQPELCPETNDYPSEFPPIVSFPGSVSFPPDQLPEYPAESSLENPEVLKPDTFIACMALCTDESAESNIEENYSQPSTETSFLPTSLPPNSSSEWLSELRQVPPAGPTSFTWLGDIPSTSLTWLGDNPSTSLTWLGDNPSTSLTWLGGNSSTSRNDTLNAASSVDSLLLSASFPSNISVEFAADTNGNLIEVESLPVCSSLLVDSSEFFPPPIDIPCVDEAGALEAPLLCDSLPAPSLNLFEDPHPGSPPVTGSLIEPYHTEEASGPETEAISTTEQDTDKVIVHDILPINNLPAEESQAPKDLSLCNTDLVNSSDNSAFVDHKHSTLIPTENALQTTENNIPDNNNTFPSEVVL